MCQITKRDVRQAAWTPQGTKEAGSRGQVDQIQVEGGRKHCNDRKYKWEV